MNKLQRFKWIPMIVKAYSDARLQQEIKLRQQDNSVHDSARSTPPSSPVKTASTRQSMETRNLSQTKRKTTRQTPVRRRTQARNSFSRGSRNSNQYTQQSYRSVLHELRETRKKLNRLESIHTQLTEMQQNLDEKLLDLFQRLESTSTSTGAPPEISRNQPKNSPYKY